MDSKNSATSSFVLMKQMPKPETKKMVAPKKNRNFKSKAKKQVNPADPGKASYGRRKTNIDSLYQDSDTKKSVMRRADEVLQSIPMEYPRFSKPMISSNVSSGFWLILPLEFCKRYMPNKDLAVVLVDDLGIQWGTSYLKKQHGFSAGWRGFAMNHRLLKGDILVFHKISPKVFKVNIVRVNDLDATDGALILMHMSTSVTLGTEHVYAESVDCGLVPSSVPFDVHQVINVELYLEFVLCRHESSRKFCWQEFPN